MPYSSLIDSLKMLYNEWMYNETVCHKNVAKSNKTVFHSECSGAEILGSTCNGDAHANCKYFNL